MNRSIFRKWLKLLLLHLILIISFSYLAILPVGSRLVNGITIVLVTQNNFIITDKESGIQSSYVTCQEHTIKKQHCLFWCYPNHLKQSQTEEMLKRNLLRKASHMLVPSLLLTSACWGWEGEAQEGGKIPELSSLATSFFVSTLSLGNCVHSHALYTVLHTPSFCMLPIFISRAPLPWAPDSHFFFDLLLVLDILSNATCWKLNMWYFPPNSLLPQVALSRIEPYPPGSLETINKMKHKTKQESIVIILFHWQSVNRTCWFNFQNVSQFWILLTIIAILMFYLASCYSI